ncbi:MAG: hypothetical protein WD738_06495 [Pirellulales bacterium]
MNMDFESIGGVRVFRPSVEIELAVRNEAEEALRRKYSAGEYRADDEINAILHEYFSFYDRMLKEHIPRVASRHFMEFVLAQYDLSSEIDNKLKGQQLDGRDSERWKKLGPVFRRAIKYLSECICLLAPDEAPVAKGDEIFEATERCWICAEQMVELSMLSTQTFALFPNDTRLELRPEGELEWFILEINDPQRFEAFNQRIRQDTNTRKNYVNETELIYNKKRVAEHLDSALLASCGFRMTDALAFAFGINRNAIQPGIGFDVPFVSEQQIIQSLTEVHGLTDEESRRLLDGLCLRKAKMAAEGRVIWKPKQEYRAYTRPFFEFPHQTGSHFVWSRKMAEECLITAYMSFAQKQLPLEWQSGPVNQAIENYVTSITTAFEAIVNSSLGTVGIVARRFKSSIGRGTSAIKIPDDIGELDTLAYWEDQKLLIVGEDKFVKPTYEPATFRDDLDKFVGKKKNYVAQLKRKTQWVLENADKIVAALSGFEGLPNHIHINQVAPALITYYPAFASCFISELPCVSLTELMIALKQNQSWPFKPVHDVR